MQVSSSLSVLGSPLPLLLLLLLLLLLPLNWCEAAGPTVISSSDFREVAERSRKLAVELSVILDRVRQGPGVEGSEEIIRQLKSKIARLETQAGEEERDHAKRVRSQKFKQMLRQFYLGDHYQFSL